MARVGADGDFAVAERVGQFLRVVEVLRAVGSSLSYYWVDGPEAHITRSQRRTETNVLRRIRNAVRVRLMEVAEETIARHRRDLEDVATRCREDLEDVAARQRGNLEDLAVRLRRDVEEIVRRESDRVIAAVHEVETRDRRDIMAAGEREAVAASARFVRGTMLTVPVFRDPLDTLAYALRLAPPDGMALEFGVFTGGTLRVIVQARNGKEVYGFDSFQGLPEDWRSILPAGAFRVDSLPEIDGAELVVGMFSDTLPGFLAEHPGPVAFLHLDADLYSSTRTVLEHVGPRLRPGSVIIFDEYFNYSGWEQHEHRAWQEFAARTKIGFCYESYTANNEQVVVRVTGLHAEHEQDRDVSSPRGD